MMKFKETSPEKKQVFNVKHNSPPYTEVTTLATDQEAPTSVPATPEISDGAREKVRAIPLGSGLLEKAATGLRGREERMKRAIEGLTD